MKNLSSEKTIRLVVAISSTIISITAILLAYFFKTNIGEFWNYFITIVGAMLLFVGLLSFYAVFKKEDQRINVKQMSMVGIMSAISVVLYYFVKFPLPFFPPWLDIQISELPALITGFAYGPFAGFLVILVRFVIKLPATITAGVGELADLVIGLVVVGISSIIYKRHKTLKGALAGTGIAIGVATIVTCFVNWLVLIPAYINIAGFPLQALIGMLNGYMPFTVTEGNFMLTYIFIGVLPFNILRFILVYVFTFLLYKRIHRLLDKITK